MHIFKMVTLQCKKKIDMGNIKELVCIKCTLHECTPGLIKVKCLLEPICFPQAKSHMLTNAENTINLYSLA